LGGRRDVLVTRPHSDKRPASLERRVRIGAAQPATLRFGVASDERGEWQLRVRVDGVVIHENTVSGNSPRWHAIRVDLSRFAGREVTLRLENGVAEHDIATGYWSDLRLEGVTLATAR
jgi:hypothetical protein